MRSEFAHVDGDFFRVRLADLKDPTVLVRRGHGEVDTVMSRVELRRLIQQASAALNAHPASLP